MLNLQFKSEFKENYLALTSLKIPLSLKKCSAVTFSLKQLVIINKRVNPGQLSAVMAKCFIAVLCYLLWY